MVFYDLCIPWSKSDLDSGALQKTLTFSAELGYNVVALEQTLSGKVPGQIKCEIPNPLQCKTPQSLRVLRRCTLILNDASQNHRLSALGSAYDLLALRPTNEKAYQQACQSLECDIISLDLSQRFDFYFKHTTVAAAVQRGIRFEICYSAGVLAQDGLARRNLISNATQLIRASKGRGIIISSGATKAVGCRGPWDVVNLTVVWGLGQERGVEAVGREAKAVVAQAEMKRRSFKGVIDITYAGDRPEASEDPGQVDKGKPTKDHKRKAVVLDGGNSGQNEGLSKSQRRKRAKMAANQDSAAML